MRRTMKLPVQLFCLFPFLDHMTYLLSLQSLYSLYKVKNYNLKKGTPFHSLSFSITTASYLKTKLKQYKSVRNWMKVFGVGSKVFACSLLSWFIHTFRFLLTKESSSSLQSLNKSFHFHGLLVNVVQVILRVGGQVSDRLIHDLLSCATATVVVITVDCRDGRQVEQLIE